MRTRRDELLLMVPYINVNRKSAVKQFYITSSLLVHIYHLSITHHKTKTEIEARGVLTVCHLVLHQLFLHHP